MIRQYLNARQIADLIGITPSAVGARARAGELPDPDVYIGATPGWGRHLARRYADQVWLDGKHVPALPDPLPHWWRRPDPVFYLCGAEVAGVLGLAAGSVASYRGRNGLFVPHRAVIGRRTHGWDHGEVMEWGIAHAYLTPEGELIPRQEHRRRKWH